jgi:hypothetical protein
MGLAGAGKDTVAQMLQRGLVGVGLEVVIGGFADYLRTISKAVGLDPFNRDIKEVPHIIGADEFQNRVYNETEVQFCRLLPQTDRAALWAYLMDELDNKFLYDGAALYPYYSISPRQFMQELGTAGRKVRDTFWIELAQLKWASQKGIVLVTDCRFDNEADVTDKTLLIVRSDVALVSPHVSEQLASDLTSGQRSIPGMDIIYNQGNLEALEIEVATYAASQALFFGSTQ